ncbi:MAG: serine protease [Candidatus Electrothrix sp. AR4]|nr:serine protease [Candidatus Electrothrix sp. AR4]
MKGRTIKSYYFYEILTCCLSCPIVFKVHERKGRGQNFSELVSRNRKKNLIAVLSVVALIAFAGSSFAESTDRKVNYNASTNWMAEYVRLRVVEKNLRSISGASSETEKGHLRSMRTPRIVGGTDAGIADNPFQVALLDKAISDNFQAQFCGGTLVKSNFVVTAAHCSDFIIASEVQVLTGTRRLDGTGVRRDVVSIATHPGWNSTTFDNDVAVWKLSSHATGIPLASLTTTDGTVGVNLLATGWGALSEGGRYPINLQRVEVPLVDRVNCNDSDSYNGEITEDMFCAGLDAGGKDACQGDSGGPLTLGNILTGITSWGTGCAEPNLYGVYTRISRDSMRGFIEDEIGVSNTTPFSPAIFMLLLR